MNAGLNVHLRKDALELYALGKISDEDCVSLEEHLLTCCVCRRRLEETDEYIRVVKAAASSLQHGFQAGFRNLL